MFDADHLIDALAGREEIEWFALAPQDDRFLAAPTDVYLRSDDGTVTWGWRVEPLPVDPAGRRFRRFRHPDGWAMLTDADDPQTIFLAAAAELHTVTDVAGAVIHALAVEPGAVPGSGDAYTLQKAADGDVTRYRLDHALAADTVRAALSLWCEVFAGIHVDTRIRRATYEESTTISQLTESEEVEDEEWPEFDVDEDVTELLTGLDDVFWFQGDLSWPDQDDVEAFRDRVDVRMRESDGTDTWLVSVEPRDGHTGAVGRLSDGGIAALDPDDPGVIRLEWDRMVLAVSLQETGFEPAGVAVALGSAPTTEQWEELRRVRGEHEGSVVIHAPAWSEGRVAAALEEWAEVWSGLRPRFLYDFDDPVSQAAIDANNLLEQAAPTARSIRTATRQTCQHTDEVTAPYEEPLPCGLPATAYYRDDDGMVLVCDSHATGRRETDHTAASLSDVARCSTLRWT
jgi:hypothetical protein